MPERTKKFIVLPAGFDDIGAVLESMGAGFEHENISWDDLKHGRIPAGCEVLFINCDGTSGNSTYAQQVAARVRAFVEQGGSLYASDYAGAIVREAFPGMLDFSQLGLPGTSKCEVVDPGLQEIIGRQISIRFDLPAWWQIKNLNPAVRVYVQKSGLGKPRPIVAGFSHGAGHVIYTSFHNQAQVSQAEQQLLRFLVLRPIMAQAAAIALKATEGQAFSVGKEIIATVNRGQPSPAYVYDASGGEGLICVLQWEGNGTLRLTVRDPSGGIVHRAEGARPPLQYEMPRAAAGRWSFVVEGANVPYDNFPYVLALGTRPASNAPVMVMRSAPGQIVPIPPGKGPYARPWSSTQPGCLIILVDQSESMDKPFGGTRLGGGRRKCDMVATMINSLLNELIQSNTVGQAIRPRADIAILGYKGASASSALGGQLSSQPFVSLPELAANPMRVETRMRREVSDDGQVVEQPVYFPVWVEPVVGSATPMCAALRQAGDLARQWAGQHPQHYPPVVINITDGASTDGDPTNLAQALCQVATAEGNALLFNCHISELAVAAVEFPESASVVPRDPEQLAPLLYALSSPIPNAALARISVATGRTLANGARGFIFNGDAGSIRQMFVFATVAATRPLADPSR